MEDRRREVWLQRLEITDVNPSNKAGSFAVRAVLLVLTFLLKIENRITQYGSILRPYFSASNLFSLSDAHCDGVVVTHYHTSRLVRHEKLSAKSMQLKVILWNFLSFD
jgi:hypothetical protein